MAKHHIVLTEEEFKQLVQMQMTPLDQLPIGDDEKAILMEQVEGKRREDKPDMIPIVICGMDDDAVVCVEVPRR